MPFKLANINGRAALVRGDDYFDLERVSQGAFGPDPMDAISRFQDLALLEPPGVSPDGVMKNAVVGPPVPRPSQIFGIGLNYRSHAAEFDVAEPETPLVFAKFPSAIAGARDEIVLSGDKVDWEVEVVAAIGREARNVPREHAWDHVAGLMVGQDISDRQKQFEGDMPQFSLGKSFAGYAPIGPVLVSLCSLADLNNLAIECEVSGQGMQAARTKQMIFDIPFLVSYLSSVLPLRPGDLIFTGTPEGVGMASGRFLRAGDVITSRVEGLGEMVNWCVNGKSG